MNAQEMLKLLARLMRSNPEAAARWLHEQGLTEQQALALGLLLKNSPHFQRPKLHPITTKAKCPECGMWFVYSRITNRRKWCSEMCRIRARSRQYKEQLRTGRKQSKLVQRIRNTPDRPIPLKAS